MSEWIKLHSGVFRHPKTLRLARLMNADPNATVGHLSALWTWTLEYAPDGDLSRYEVEEVELATGCPDGFIAFAVKAGYLDRKGKSLSVHDWNDYAGALVEARERNAERMRNARAANVQSTCGERAGLEKKERVERENFARPRTRGAGPRAREEAVDNSRSNGNGSPTCYLCGSEITDAAVMLKDGRLRHQACAPAKTGGKK